jgi:ankyrin repeat protein
MPTSTTPQKHVYRISALLFLLSGEFACANSSLISAAEAGNLDSVRQLIHDKADVNCRDSRDDPVLLVAARSGHVEVVQALIAAGANVNAKTHRWGHTALSAASEQGHLEVVQALIAAGADVNAGGALDAASGQGRLEVVRTLIAAGADAKRVKLIGVSSLDVVRALIAAGANVNFKDGIGDTALLMACLGGHFDVARALIAAGADVNVAHDDKKSPLFIAAREGELETVVALIKAKADVNGMWRDTKTIRTAATPQPVITDQTWGVTEYHYQVLAVRRQFTRSMTALMAASENGHLGIVRALIDAGADVNARTPQRNVSALFIASQNGHPEIVRALIEAKADVDVINSDAEEVCVYKDIGGGVSLIDLDCGKKAVFRQAINPLMAASENGHQEIVRALVDAGADVRIKSSTSGVTALSLASKNGHQEIVRLLEEAESGSRGQRRPARWQEWRSEQNQPQVAKPIPASSRPAACGPLPPNTGLRFDGLYQAAGENPSQWYYLRFYVDGTVLSSSFTGGTPQQVAHYYLNKQHDSTASGCVTIVSAKLQFATVSKEGAVEYSGSVQGDGLALHTISRINGHVADKLYRFNPIQFEATP